MNPLKAFALPRYVVPCYGLVFCTLALIVAAVFSTAASAQTVATGDGRGTVPEPTFPTVCTQVPADLTISAGEPSSELNTVVDTTAIRDWPRFQAAPRARAVELVANGSNNAFVIAPIFIPPGAQPCWSTAALRSSLPGTHGRLPDRHPTATGSTCGTSDGGSACNPLITIGQKSINGSSVDPLQRGATCDRPDGLARRHQRPRRRQADHRRQPDEQNQLHRPGRAVHGTSPSTAMSLVPILIMVTTRLLASRSTRSRF